MDEETSYIQEFMNELKTVLITVKWSEINCLVDEVLACKLRGGRVFFLGVGGSAANASHACNDFRKNLGMEAYTPTDNCAEITARTNDDGWVFTFIDWLKINQLNHNDLVFVLSVGGGTFDASTNIMVAVEYASSVDATIVGITGPDGGHTAYLADVCVRVPSPNPKHTTPHTETLQLAIIHLLVNHPDLKDIGTGCHG